MKQKIILCFKIMLFLMVSHLSAQTVKSFSVSEIIKHNKKDDCWMLINNKVYDVTSYIPLHPAPLELMLKYCGKDASQGFKTKDISQDHHDSSYKLLEKYYIGDLLRNKKKIK